MHTQAKININRIFKLIRDKQFSNSPFYLESSAFFMFSKILSAYKYGVGKKLKSELESWEDSFPTTD